jgi:hypothetical protein
MAFTLSEAVSDLPAVLAFVQASEAAISAMPAKAVAKPSDYIKMAVAILSAAAPVADQIEAQIAS